MWLGGLESGFLCCANIILIITFNTHFVLLLPPKANKKQALVFVGFGIGLSRRVVSCCCCWSGGSGQLMDMRQEVLFHRSDNHHRNWFMLVDHLLAIMDTIIAIVGGKL